MELLERRKNSIGPVYLVGYAVESALKAYLRRNNIKFPGSGGEGHNLKRLWKSAGLTSSDLHDEGGCKTFFFDTWSTDLRYETELSQTNDSESLVKAAGQLVGWINKLSKRIDRKSKYKGKR